MESPRVPEADAAPFLSVLIPSYNGGHYLAEAIESVLSQPCRDMEVLVLDDGSVDDTLDIAQAASQRDGRVRVLSHGNWGAGRTRNQGIDEARGRWLLFVDSDDAVLPGFYTDQVRRFLGECLDRDVEVIVPARLEADEALGRARLSRVPHEGVFPAGSDVCWSIHHEFATLLYATAMVRREGLRFGELRPEMESIFRHKAVFLARKSLFTNELWFAVRRDNPEQTTKNWDMEAVNVVREREYGRLLRWHVERGTQGFVLEEARRRLEECQRTLAEQRRRQEEAGLGGEELAAEAVGVELCAPRPAERARVEESSEGRPRGVVERLRSWWQARSGGSSGPGRAEGGDDMRPLGEYVLNEAQQARALESVAKM